MAISSFIFSPLLGEGYMRWQMPRIKAHRAELTFHEFPPHILVVSFWSLLARPQAHFFFWCLNCNFIKNLKPSLFLSLSIQTSHCRGLQGVFKAAIVCHKISEEQLGEDSLSSLWYCRTSSSPSESILLSLSLSWLYHSKAQAAQQNINEKELYDGERGKRSRQNCMCTSALALTRAALLCFTPLSSVVLMQYENFTL